ncbi:hypothetical protein K469DRAFT_715900 [Zopfia rhizophila CBS 207.26]|uniref:Uncharacterized protein n=1 Tax=Zopfia rhizophila CBS 207.26 TaxID=1314779 RepID=A0A6A6DJV8_9PEZI|nr:hypothetical protein K469DRAFT_715900 [Zopfia rhizophila CBS 207.26]
MPDDAPNSKSANSPFETPGREGEKGGQNFAPPHHHHYGPGIADSIPVATLPPTLTPATTTRQSVSLGVLSTLWGSTNNPTTSSHNTSPPPDTSIPSIITHAPSPETQKPPSDLTGSSIPSTTTTLTNTLPPTQSAALRALNAPAFQSHTSSNPKSKSAKSTSSRTTLSSQPVVVRTYSGSRHTSRPSSGVNSPRLFPNMNGSASGNPSVEEFSFSAILRAVDPEIRDAIDAIAEICARSRYSLADEYDAHLPPQGEITSTGVGWGMNMGALMGRGRISRVGQGWTAAENTLTAVPEASSSSERLAGDSRGSVTGGSGKIKRSQSAYGSLKSVISGGSGKRKAIDVDAFKSDEQVGVLQNEEQKPLGPHWAVNASSPSNHPSIILVTSPKASKQLSLDISSSIKDIPEGSESQSNESPLNSPNPKQMPLHRRHTSTSSIPHFHTGSSTLSSIVAWIPWHRGPDLDPGPSSDTTQAEARLKEMLKIAQASRTGKGKAPVGAA